MKKKIFTMLFAMSLTCSFARQASAHETISVPESSALVQEVDNNSIMPLSASVGRINGDGVRLRKSAGLSAAILGTLNNGDSVVITDEPRVYADGYYWICVESDRLGIYGWVAEIYVTATPV